MYLHTYYIGCLASEACYDAVVDKSQFDAQQTMAHSGSPCTEEERSMSVKLVMEQSARFLLLARCSFLLALLALFLILLALLSPHMLVPPCVDGMFSRAMPCKVGPPDKFKGTPSHYHRKRRKLMLLTFSRPPKRYTFS